MSADGELEALESLSTPDDEESEEYAYENPFDKFLEEGVDRSVSTQEVLSWYGRERRGAAVVRWIHSDLEDLELVMSPPIEEADYYGNVEIENNSSDSDEEGRNSLEDSEEPERVAEGDSRRSSSASVSGWILSSLKPDAGTLDFLTYGQTTDHAVDIMKTRGRSKLPLFFDGADRTSLIGTVTLADLTMESATSESKLIDLAQTKVPVLPTSDSLMDWIPVILQHGFVYGKNADGQIVQIYTVSDVASHLNALAQMFLRVNELEDLIRGLLSRFDEDDVKKAKSSAGSLTKIPLNEEQSRFLADSEVSAPGNIPEHVVNTFMFSDYMKCFGDPDLWNQLSRSAQAGMVLDKEKCIRSLNDARLARNKVMHISSQDVLDGLIPSFEAAAVWLRRL